MNYVITVDEADEPIGFEEKLTAHVKGILHRAFSVFVYNDRNELLLQQRAADKYHSGGLWTNSCCSHPSPGEDTEVAAHRRLQEELGFDCALSYWKPFYYHAVVDNNLTEHEIDHLFTGTYNGPVPFNPAEVSAYQFVALPEIREWMAARPHDFTAWFRLIMAQL